MPIKLNDDALNGAFRGFDLIQLAQKVRCLGDMVQAVHQSRYPEMGFDTEGTIGSIIADYGRLIESIAVDVEGEVSALWKNHNDSRIRFFKTDYERFKATWRKGVHVDNERAHSFLDEVRSFIDQHDPSSLYKIRDELEVMLKDNNNGQENEIEKVRVLHQKTP